MYTGCSTWIFASSFPRVPTTISVPPKPGMLQKTCAYLIFSFISLVNPPPLTFSNSNMLSTSTTPVNGTSALATVRSTGPKSTSTSVTPSTGQSSVPPSSWISSCLRGSIWSIAQQKSRQTPISHPRGLWSFIVRYWVALRGSSLSLQSISLENGRSSLKGVMSNGAPEGCSSGRSGCPLAKFSSSQWLIPMFVICRYFMYARQYSRWYIDALKKDYAAEIANRLSSLGLFADVDNGENTLPKKIRNGEIAQYNFILGVFFSVSPEILPLCSYTNCDSRRTRRTRRAIGKRSESGWRGEQGKDTDGAFGWDRWEARGFEEF